MNLDPDNFYHKIFWKDDSEFASIRKECLKEDGWLREIYLPENLIIEKHMGYAVVFQKETDQLVGMGGLFNDGRYPAKIGRHLHREYCFPQFRQRSFTGLVSGFKLYNEHIIKPLNLNSGLDAYFVGMQTRYKKNTMGYWKVFSSAIVKGVPGMKIGDGLVQTCSYDVQKCWQNYVYFEHTPNSFRLPTIDYARWNTFPQGD